MDATSASDMLTVLEYVDHFYANSWNHLIFFVGVAVGVVGVIVPILMQISQGLIMRHERKVIRSAIMGEVSVLLEDKIGAATKALERRLARDRAELEEGVRKTEAELRKEIAGTLGGVYHVQLLMGLSQHAYRLAFHSAVRAISKMIEADDHLHLRVVLCLLTEHCLPHMARVDFDELKEDVSEFERLMPQIKEWDVKGDFGDEVNQAKRAFKAASELGPGAKT